MDTKLASIADDLKSGRDLKPVSVREFLGWFGVQRRGYNIVHDIRSKLKEAGLITEPDFESTWIDGEIGFRLRTAPQVSASLNTEVGASFSGTAELGSVPAESPVNWVTRDPAYSISKLAAANGGVVSVSPDALLSEAVTRMMSQGFSQLPVMTGQRDVKGVISWMSVGSRLALSDSHTVPNCHHVRSMMQQAHEVRADTSIFDAISLIVQHGYTLVRDATQKITGIVTASDLSMQFRDLTEPFLLLSEIENSIRNMIGDRFTAAQLIAARDPGAQEREVSTVADLTFGEYIRLLENPERWEMLKLAIDRSLFCRNLDEVRRIRNDVTHFDPDGITQNDLDVLRNFTSFLKHLQEIRRR